MAHGTFQVPYPVNEPVLSYAPGSSEREELNAMYNKMYNQDPIDVPMYIGSEEVRTSDKRPMTPPHDHAKVLGHFNYGDASHVEVAIDSALEARTKWAAYSYVERASIFLKAADLVAGKYRAKINASTMLAQSKNCFQAEIDAACELTDFLRFNAYFGQQIMEMQPESADGIWNRTEYRSLEGFVFAVTPFNFTAIAANLPACMALMGNVVVWKPADSQMYSAQVLMEIFKEAGVPNGVINMVTVDGPVAGDVVFNHPDFSGLHFTGSTAVFRHLWKTIGENIAKYKTYPRIVGETGGKDFIVAHKSANPKHVSTAITRGAFEFQGQKCSAASRGYISESIWDDVKKFLEDDLSSISMGSPENFENFVTSVIDEKSFDKISTYIKNAKSSKDAEVIMGGNCDKKKGYFIEPTVILTKDPNYVTMREEIFGPVMTIYVFPDSEFTKTLELVDKTSEYALTGAILANDRYVIEKATKRLKNSAGNFYINDKPTGAVVGKQPFGGARGSGTNDKAGSMLNLLRWVSPRLIKETFVTPTDFRYPFLEKEK